jgi:hypothetical protein
MDVVFRDGTVVRASSISDRVEHDPTRSFGLYLDALATDLARRGGRVAGLRAPG